MEKLAESIRQICQREYGFEVDARLVGKTLYVSCEPDNLIGKDLGIQRETVEKLYDAMLTATRVALSTDAQVEFLAVKARDAALGVTVTLLRYFPDVKWFLYMRISRAEAEDRIVIETDHSSEPEPPESWNDISMPEFMARLSASRLQQRFTSNALVSVFLQVHRVRGSFANGVLTVTVDKFHNAEDTRLLIDEVLETAVVERVGDVLEKYDAEGRVRRVAVREDAGRVLLDLPAQAVLEKKKAIPRKKAKIGAAGS